MIRIGCSGWAKGHAVYRSEFSAVEIQESFYNLLPLSRAEKWKREFPPDFIFALKAPQLITHLPASPTYRRLKKPVSEDKKDRFGFFRNTPEFFEAWAQAAEFAALLGARDVIFQCPKSFTPSSENKKALKGFFKKAGKTPFRLGLEVRGAWTRDDVKPFVDSGYCYHVIDPFFQTQYGDEFIYYRLHGKGTYHYRYSAEELEELAQKTGAARDGYIFFNNVPMRDNALEFKKLSS